MALAAARRDAEFTLCVCVRVCCVEVQRSPKALRRACSNCLTVRWPTRRRPLICGWSTPGTSRAASSLDGGGVCVCVFSVADMRAPLPPRRFADAAVVQADECAPRRNAPCGSHVWPLPLAQGRRCRRGRGGGAGAEHVWARAHCDVPPPRTRSPGPLLVCAAMRYDVMDARAQPRAGDISERARHRGRPPRVGGVPQV